MQTSTFFPNEIEDEWEIVFTKAQSSQLIVLPPSFPSTKLNALDAGLKRSDHPWLIGLHWFYKKKWNRKYRIPCSPKLAKIIEPIGDYFWAIAEMAQDVHFFRHPLSRSWDGAGDWSAAIIEEIRHDDTSRGIGRLLSGESKDAEIQRTRAFLRELKEQQFNPCDSSTHPAYHQLIEASFQMIKDERYENFKNKHWTSRKTNHIYTYKGFLGSVSRYIGLLESPHACAMKIKNNSLFIRTKQGEKCIKTS
jgi:hypothetical protein